MIYMVSFTKNGANLSNKLKNLFIQNDIDCEVFSVEKYAFDEIVPLASNIYDWVREYFQKGNILIFIGACGIAVRAIAPFVKDKQKDAGVIVIDEKGEFVIPILSAHLGGATKLSVEISRLLNSTPVITTSTDINNCFAVDLFAKKNNLIIDDIKKIKVISSALLDGYEIGYLSDVNGLDIDAKNVIKGENFQNGVLISPFIKIPYPNTIRLIPKCIKIGMGCKKDIEYQKVEKVFLNAINKFNIDIRAVIGLYSITLKKEEASLIELSKKYNLEFFTYSAKELNDVNGEFIKSEFVQKTTGVDNVCQRAAKGFDDSGEFLVEKFALNGVTISVFMKNLDAKEFLDA